MKAINFNLSTCHSYLTNIATEAIQKIPSAATVQSTAENCFKYLGLGAAYNYLAQKVIEPLIVNGFDFCPELPKVAHNYASAICSINAKLAIGNTQDFMTISAPIVEEMIFRVGLQETLLKKLPKDLLSKKMTSEEAAQIVDSKLAKIARVAISASAFSLAHALPPSMGWPNCSATKLVSMFVLGLGLGSLQEVTGNPLYSIFAHAGNNLMGGYLLRNLGMTPICPS